MADSWKMNLGFFGASVVVVVVGGSGFLEGVLGY